MSKQTKAVAKSGATLITSMPAPLQSYLQATLAQIADAGDDAETLWAVAQRAFEMEMAGRVVAGRALLELSKRLDKAEFAAELASRHVSRSAYFNAVAVYQAFAELPDERSVQTFGLLGQAKAVAVLSWSPKERLAFARGEKVRGVTADQAVEMSAREFAEAVRDPELVKAGKQIASLEADNEALQADLKALQGQLKHRYENLKMPDFAAHARQESVALAEGMLLSVTALEALVQERLTEDKEAGLYPEWAERAAGTLYHSARAVHARLEALMARIHEQWGKPVTGKIDFEHSLSPGELEIAAGALDIVVKRHAAQAHNREADRIKAKGGRGRPLSKKAVA